MDEKLAAKLDEQKSRTVRRIGKLFGKEKKGGDVRATERTEEQEEDVATFLHGTSDKLHMTGTEPKLPLLLTKIDTSSANRWPAAEDINSTRPVSRSSLGPRHSKKGLTVRFTDSEPEIIGEGGDTASLPVLQISVARRKAQALPVRDSSTAESKFENSPDSVGQQTMSKKGDSRPRGRSPMPASQLGKVVDQIPEIRTMAESSQVFGQGDAPDVKSDSASGILKTTQSNAGSFAARIHAEMRAAEGRALSRGFRTQSPSGGHSSAVEDQSKPANSVDIPVDANPPVSTPSPASLEPSNFIPHPPAPQLKLPSVPRKPVKSPTQSVHSATLAASSDSLDDFSDRVYHLFKLFHLSAESVMPLKASSFVSLAGAASWWFLKGKQTLEAAIGGRRIYGAAFPNLETLRQQGHADIAKSIWLVQEVFPQRPELGGVRLEESSSLVVAARAGGDHRAADMLEHCLGLLVNLCKFVMSLKRNDFLPPKAEDAPLPQGLDMAIWVPYPSLPEDIHKLMSHNEPSLHAKDVEQSSIRLSEALPLGDTKEFFHYTDMFVLVSFTGEGSSSRRGPYPCMLCVRRPRNGKNLEVLVSNQNLVICVLIRADNEAGPTWKDVLWQSRNSTLEVKLAKGVLVFIQCLPPDFEALGDTCDRVAQIHGHMSPRQGEVILTEEKLKVFQYFERDSRSRSFPDGPVPDCLVRLFEVTEIHPSGAKASYKKRVSRLAVVTGPGLKFVSGATHDFIAQQPVQYGFMRGDGGDPALLIKFVSEARRSTIVLTFEGSQHRAGFYDYITGGLRGGEKTILHVPLNKYAIVDQSAPNQASGQTLMDPFQWQSVSLISTANISSAGKQTQQLRILAEARNGRFDDRINARPGEMRIKLSSHLSACELSILPAWQRDLSIAIAEAQLPKDIPGYLHHLLYTTARLDTVRTYHFPSLQHLHAFQQVVTSFKVVYDGISEMFSISRHRVVVPIAKKFEASQTRIQIAVRALDVHLIAFFGDGFIHGECMNVALGGAEVFETFNKSGKFCLRITDARFAMPRGYDEGIERGFICIEMPDNPTERDDITMVFNNEADRDQLAQVLPAPARAVSRLGALKK